MEQAEKKLPDGLEEEIEFYLDHAELKTTCNGISAADAYFNDLKRTARHFAEWMEAKMLEGAVEGEVYLYRGYKRKAIAILVDIPKDKLGDKVKIIIVKEGAE